ncbi:MAG: cysteine desulfurase [Candidatus Pristimantibacillus lignocellulolyticus]|uniref:cysteine desulfurase n=1 Tax=Candidatus Pristimantibacillus lignocellulolyticus TaxID=2994561 RepID=A0A9J6ZAA9_9BACL|nr:MAG: cysteine desulfurase [Candidatus Pristimantibacillus lignocellulolyticus]
MKSYYFDHAATTPLDPDVIAAMIATMQQGPGNASSIHRFGRNAKHSLNQSRDKIASILGCKSNEFTFTSGGTESDNLAIIGAARAQALKGRKHLITSAIEHHAVIHSMEWLAKHEGFDLTIISVDQQGYVNLTELKDALSEQTALVSIMHGNNEVGTIQPIEQIGELVHQVGALFHVDAVQTLGRVPYSLQQLPIDLMSFSSHKINGPQGIGGLYIATGTPIEALQQGGSQERKRRAGTENLAGIVGFATALDICVNKREKWQPFVTDLRNRWVELLQQELEQYPIIVNSDLDHGLSHIVNISFVGVDTESMLMNLDMAGIAVSSGSACTSGSLERSHVLKAMGLSADRLNSAVRFSFGMGNTIEEIEEAATIVASIVKRINS